MGEAVRDIGMSTAAFLDWESRQRERYELRAGEACSMGGGTSRHHLVALNLTMLLRQRLKGRGCLTYHEGMKLRLDSGDVLYADAMVVCRPVEGTAPFVTAPSLVAEVLLPRTEADDRGAKWELYRTLESLRHYLLIHQDHWCVASLVRGASGWEPARFAGADAVLPLEAFDLRLGLADLYEDTTIPVTR